MVSAWNGVEEDSQSSVARDNTCIDQSIHGTPRASPSVVLTDPEINSVVQRIAIFGAPTPGPGSTVSDRAWLGVELQRPRRSALLVENTIAHTSDCVVVLD